MNLRKMLESVTKVLASWGGAGSIADEFWKHRSEHEERKAKLTALLQATEVEWRPDASPAALLRADFGVVPFHGRKAELEDLEAWATDGPKVAVRLYTAPGGFGKTRLLQEHVRLWGKSGWGRAGFLREGQVLELGAEVLFEGEEKALLVVLDYAESRGAEIEAVVEAARTDGSARPRTRVVLLARSEGDWWAALRKAKDGVGDFFQGPCVEGPLELAPLTSPARSAPHPPNPLLLASEEKGGSEGSAVLAARRESFQLAARAFAEKLGKAVSVGVPPLDGEDFDRVLLIHAAALAAVEQESVPSGGLLDWLLLREERGLDRVRQACGLGAEYERAMRHGAVLLTLAQGADSRGEVVEILQRVPSLAGEGAARLGQMAEALHVLYRGRRWCDGVEPDLVGEHLVRKELGEAPELVAAAFDEGVPEARLESGLTVLNRLAQRKEETGRELLGRVLDAGLERLGPVAVRVAVTTGDPIGQVLAEALEARGSVDLARQIQPHLPYPTTALREAGAVVYGLLRRELLDRGVENLNEEEKQRVAGWSNDLSIRLAEIGRPEEALEASQEAVEIFRDLARTQPDAFRPALASSLNNLGIRLSGLGRREKAMEAARKAVGIYRKLARTGPDAFRPDLARSLNNLGAMLSGLGRLEEALEATREAVDIRRVLARTRPDAFRSDAAGSLDNLGKVLSDLGRREEALEATREAVDLYRDLARTRPDAFRPDFAMSLHNLGNRLSALGRREEALEATHKAVNLYRDLARTRPDAFRPDLARSLHNLGNMFSNLGRREEALEVTRQAVDLYRDLARSWRDAFLPDLAGSLNNLGLWLSGLGRRKEAVAAAREAVALLLPFFERWPAAFGPQMANHLENYLEHCQEAGQEPETEFVTRVQAVFQSLKAPPPDPPDS